MTTALTTIKRDRYSVEPGTDVHTFAVGATYYGSLICEHSEFRLVCINRTAKSVWLAEVYPAFVNQDGTIHSGESWKLPRRSKVKWIDGYRGLMETTSLGPLMIDAYGQQCGNP